MTVGDIKANLLPILEDGFWAEQALDKENNQFTRRSYIRSVFAIIEGCVWVLKQTILHAPVRKGRIKKLALAEYALLSEKAYELKNNGAICEQKKYLKLQDNIRFTFGLINKYFKSGCELGVGTKSWDNFLKAQKIRDRITHPKGPDEIEISDSDLKICKSTSSWFNKLILDFIDSLTPNAQK